MAGPKPPTGPSMGGITRRHRGIARSKVLAFKIAMPDSIFVLRGLGKCSDLCFWLIFFGRFPKRQNDG